MNQIKNYTLPVLVLLSGIFLSTISAYYSILGLISIFSGSALLITLMGIAIEYGKVASCLWLHKHWNDKIGFLKLYLSVAIIVLMMITSLGIYGFLTKANLKQSEGINLNNAKVFSLESNISREQTKLDLNTRQINQYNLLLNKLITEDVRRASNERRRIQSQITSLAKESKEIAKSIDNLNTELLPYKSEINAVEVEVGTLLYISKLIYGEEYKQYLPQTLTALTLLIIFVFDPLAIGLLIASQKSFGFINKKEKPKLKEVNISSENIKVDEDLIANANKELKLESSRENNANESGVIYKVDVKGLSGSGEDITYTTHIPENTRTWRLNPYDYSDEKYLEDAYDDLEQNNELEFHDEVSNIPDDKYEYKQIDYDKLLESVNKASSKLDRVYDEFIPINLDDNRWELYESDEPFQGLESAYDEPKIDIENVDEVEQEDVVEAIGRLPKMHRRASKK